MSPVSRFFIVLCTLGALPALADIPSPEQYACNLKKPGDPCELKEHDGTSRGTGVCKQQKCSKMLPPGREYTYDCIVCVVEKGTPAIPAPSGPTLPEPSEPPKTDDLYDTTEEAPDTLELTPSSGLDERMWLSLGVGLVALGAGVGLTTRPGQRRKQ